MTGQISSREVRTITLAGAQRLVKLAIAAPERQGIPMSVVVVDAAGQPVHVARMDDATMLSFDVAWNKAWTAAMAGASTDDVHDFIRADEGSLRSMPQLQRFTVVSGGLPILVDGRCVGAIGVSGGPAPIDVAVAQAALRQAQEG